MRPSTTSASASSSRKRRRGRLAAALLLLWGSGCVSFRVSVPDEAELTVAYVALLPAVEEGAGFATAVSSQPVSPGAAAVCALIKVQRIVRPVVLRWRWYAPDGSLARESPALTVNARRAELEYAAAWDRLPGVLFNRRPGNWQVVIQANDRLLARADFVVPEATSAAPPGG